MTTNPGTDLPSDEPTTSPEAADLGSEKQPPPPSSGPPRDPIDFFRWFYRRSNKVPTGPYAPDIAEYRHQFGTTHQPSDADLRSAIETVRKELRQPVGKDEGEEHRENEGDSESDGPSARRRLGKTTALGGAIALALLILGRALYFLQQGKPAADVWPFITSIMALTATSIALGVTYFVVNSPRFPKRRRLIYANVVVVIGLCIVAAGAAWLISLFYREVRDRIAGPTTVQQSPKDQGKPPQPGPSAPPPRVPPRTSLAITHLVASDDAQKKHTWLVPQFHFLETEGRAAVNEKLINDYICVLIASAPFRQPTTTFSIDLTVPRRYRCSGFVFRMKTDTTGESFQPLLLAQSKVGNSTVTNVKVPECDVGDQILFVLKLSAKESRLDDIEELRSQITLAIRE